MLTLTAALAWHARATPDRLALVYRGTRQTYGSLHRRVLQVSGWLHAQGIARGDVVAVLMKNSAAFIEIALATSHLGAVFLPVNYRLAADEVDYITGHAGARLLLVDDELQPAAPAALRRVVLDDAAQQDSTRLCAMPDASPDRQPDLPPAAQVGPDDLFRLMYTSGTTDRPKGVIHSYGNYYWKCLDHMIALGLSRDDRLLVVGPLYHVGAFDLPGLALLLAGGSLHLLREFEPDQVLALIDAERLTCGWLAPVMLNRVLALPQRHAFDLTSLRWLIGGGERTPEERIREFTTLFTAARYIDGYGLTESCSGDTLMQAGMELTKIGSVGRALAHVEVAICDDSGAFLPAGSAGEIVLRGPKITRGYWRDPQRTRDSFFADWFRTGDVGLLDEDGFLFLTDRKKDMIISGGENISSSEVERVIYQLAQVSEAAVIGLPDERWGERVVAVVVARDGAGLTQQALHDHCRAQLAGFKVPRQLVLRDALPRNPSGKVLKRVLRDELKDLADSPRPLSP